MPDAHPHPAEADFTKTLVTVLLAEYLGAIAAHATSLALSSAGPIMATATSLAANCLLIQVLAMNIATMAAACGMRSDPAYAPLMRTSLTLTAGQVVLLAASFLSTSLAFHAIAAGLTAVTLVAAIFITPGKFLRHSA
jgi:hypothetical protein